jgi:hypothetical protein
LAARQQFTEQIGLITAAFYAPKAGSRGRLPSTLGPGTGRGKDREEEVPLYEGVVPGDLVAVVHLRYVEPETLKGVLENGSQPAPEIQKQ